MREQIRMTRGTLTPALAALALLLSACGSAGGGSTLSTTTGGADPAATTAPPASSTRSTASVTSSTSATTATPPTATTATPPTATTSTSTATSTSETAGSPPCQAAGLHLSFLGQQGGMGHGEIGFVLRNTSATGCRTYGYPGIQFLDEQGRPLPTIPHHTTRDFFGSGPAQHLVIAPGASASFRLDVGHGVATSNGCATAYGLQIIPPDDTATLRATIPEGAYECRDANVSPVRAGASAYP